MLPAGPPAPKRKPRFLIAQAGCIPTPISSNVTPSPACPPKIGQLVNKGAVRSPEHGWRLGCSNRVAGEGRVRPSIKPARAEFEASEDNLLGFLQERTEAKPHLLHALGETHASTGSKQASTVLDGPTLPTSPTDPQPAE